MDKKRKYDLNERTALFGEAILEFVKNIFLTTITKPLVSQLVRAGTSVGANYCEANDAETVKDFIHKIGICRKESKETQHWLRMIVKVLPKLKEEAGVLWREASELNLIFSASIRTARNNTHI